jgi:hypothetical protein
MGMRQRIQNLCQRQTQIVVPPDWPMKKAESENIVESTDYRVMKGGRTARIIGLESAKPGARPGVLR